MHFNNWKLRVVDFGILWKLQQLLQCWLTHWQ